MLLSFFISSLKRTIPEEGWGRYLISGGEWSHYDVSSWIYSESFRRRVSGYADDL